MTRHPIIALCASVLSCGPAAGPVAPLAPAAPAVPAAPASTDGPEAAVATYFRAGNAGSSALMRAAFHAAAPLQSVDAAGALQLLPQLEWWQRIDAAKAVPTDERRFEILDREGLLALVEVVATWPTHLFHDLLLVVRTPDGWRIVGKVFEKRAPGSAAASRPEDDAEIRAVLATKIAAAAGYDPALLARSHTPLCQYYGVTDGPPALASVSEWAAIYAGRRDRGEVGRHQWTVRSVVVRGTMAAAKLEATLDGKRIVDHLLLVRVAAGWRIAAATWGSQR